MDIRLIIADEEEEYIHRLYSVLSENEHFTVSMYSNEAALRKSLTKRHDLLLVSPGLAQQLYKDTAAPILVLTDPEEPQEAIGDFKKINKYQRVEKIVRILMQTYGETSAGAYGFAQEASFYSVYSPAGGCGKTTVALSLAMQLGAQNRRVLYVDFEGLPSVATVFEDHSEEKQGLSYIFEKLDGDTDAAAIIQSVLYQKEGIFYMQGFRTPRDAWEIGEQDVGRFIRALEASGVCDCIVADLDSSLSPMNQALMAASDKVILVEPAKSPGREKARGYAELMEYKSEDKNLGVVNFGTGRPGNAFPLLGSIAAISEASPLKVCRLAALQYPFALELLEK